MPWPGLPSSSGLLRMGREMGGCQSQRGRRGDDCRSVVRAHQTWCEFVI
jgi:hypothetical protein